VRRLVEKGDNVDSRSKSGWTPLSLAAANDELNELCVSNSSTKKRGYKRCLLWIVRIFAGVNLVNLATVKR